MSSLIPFLIPFLSFLLQSYPRFFNRFFGVDVWTRLLETDHVRKNHHKIPKDKLSGQFIIDGYFDYPPIFPTLLSYFPKNTLLQIQGFIAPFIDALHVLFIFYIASFLTGNVWFALIAQLLYMATPMIALENSYLTPRSLGYLNFSITTVSLLLFIATTNPLWLVIGVVSAVLIFLTHRFATQSFLFISIFFTYFLNTPLFIQVFLFGFASAVILTEGYYLRVLKGHLFNIYFWVCNLDFRFAHQVRGILKKETKTEWVGKVYQFLSVFSPVAVFGLNPWAFSAFVYEAVVYLGWIPGSFLLHTFAAWILFFYAFGVVVLKIKHLMPIGEGQRYMEMATLPSVFLSTYLAFKLFDTPYRQLTAIVLAGIIIFNLTLILVIQLKGVINDKNRSVTGELQKIFLYVNKMKKTPRIICVPHQNTTLMVYHTKAQVFVNADNPGLMRVQETYPILKKSLKEMAEKYDLTHALIRTGFVTLKELNLKQKDVEFASGDVMLVKI